ncbi:uncharacterized protein COLE_02653 [Cutaneotrichosporon oleaginosum]|uniref:uncharacterized protein n=1 Tax=Cutaneotrichosporon oleaginosum TaxID=879819 RepID=UPI001324484F|nr:hypothetical protein COLE_02653 [Cutaneotrichosporon oleaginosum]
MGDPNKYRKSRSFQRRLTLLTSIALCALLTWVGYWSYSTDQAMSGLWGCEMAYMYPSFSPLEGVDTAGSRYALFLYREGGMDPPVPSGHPVIFIPGNAGSYKQARSIGASVAAQFHKGRDTTWTKSVDLFTVDFNEDLSALHAPTLRSQAQFLVKAIARVYRAYEHLPADERPAKVILLGHSMGGIVARLASTMAQPTMWQPSPVDVILTMSTPHLQPPAPLDPEMERIYAEINSVRYSDPSPLLISICGGTSDVQIVSDACALTNSLIGRDDGFAVFTTGIPGVWTGVEHQAMVWCDQVRYRVARTLLDMGEAASRQGKLSAAQRWLLGISETQPALPTLDTTTRVEVVASRMAILLKLTYPTEVSLVSPPVTAQFCEEEGVCSDQTFSSYSVPWLPVSERPFPLLGEGSRPEESVFVLDFDLPEVNRGWLEIRHPLGASVHSGPLVDQTVVGSRWSEWHHRTRLNA